MVTLFDNTVGGHSRFEELTSSRSLLDSRLSLNSSRSIVSLHVGSCGLCDSCTCLFVFSAQISVLVVVDGPMVTLSGALSRPLDSLIYCTYRMLLNAALVARASAHDPLPLVYGRAKRQ